MLHSVEIYNATNYKGAPYHPISIMYGYTVAHHHKQPTSFIGDDPWSIDYKKFEKYLVDLPAGQPIVCDIEHWPLNDGDSKAWNDSMMMYRLVLKFMKEVRPDVEIGNYVGPPSHARGISSFKNTFSADYKYWLLRNEAIAPLADYLDWVTPNLYWSTRSSGLAEQYANAVISESSRYRRQGLKVVPFIMPRAEIDGVDGKPIGASWFKDWLQDFVYPFVDGVILWDYGKHKDRFPPWLGEML